MLVYVNLKEYEVPLSKIDNGGCFTVDGAVYIKTDQTKDLGGLTSILCVRLVTGETRYIASTKMVMPRNAEVIVE